MRIPAQDVFTTPIPDRNYQKILRRHELRVSTSDKGNCYNNSAVESFFKSLKAELVWRRHWHIRHDVEISLFDYINGLQPAPKVLSPRLEIHPWPSNTELLPVPWTAG